MFARMVSMQLEPNARREFTEKFENEIIPTLKRQPGFQEEMLFAVRSQPGFVEMYAGNQFISLTFWETEEDAERFTRDVFPPY